MAKPNQTIAPDSEVHGKSINLAELLSTETTFTDFDVWLVGNRPLITHAWSFKAKHEMLQKQIGATKPGKTKRDPQEDYINSLYDMGDSTFGFPAMGLKNSILSAAHKDKGIPKSVVQSSLWLDADLTQVRPALAGAACDMPLLRIHGSGPEMREDMVRIGSGLNKTANLAYRGQFKYWALRVTGNFNATTMKPEHLLFLLQDAGRSYGIGEWRKDGFGSFHVADIAEQEAWGRFVADTGPLPTYETNLKLAA